jgi:ATPase subunit of ABC transporter with duplicated ATPase domains
MSARSEEEHSYPNVDLSNLAAWYRHLVQNDPKENAAFIKSLQNALDGFAFLKLADAGEKVRILIAEFADSNNKSVDFGLGELSDGQRCLICLYMVLHFVVAKGSTVILDEPDNFVSLREIQPWLVALADAIEEGQGQVFLISHHPECINQWAPNYGVQFRRDGIGPVRLGELHVDLESSLSPSELIARGWENE